jgi:hypothetical protein
MSDPTIAVLADALRAERDRSFRNPRPRAPRGARRQPFRTVWRSVRRLAEPASVAIHVPPHLRPDHPEVVVQRPMPDLARRGMALAGPGGT